ncbi:MAG TPA: ribose 5-phosphate isomerase B [Dehalococcoidia bacterium]|nr:ribose 5-phosphate isomerase B [Dehalococcoidia bacterium]
MIFHLRDRGWCGWAQFLRKQSSGSWESPSTLQARRRPSLRIAVGSDHAGFHLKQQINALLEELGHEYYDFGCDDPGAVDYPDIAQPVAEAVASGEFERGILVCGTGAGMAIAANKVQGIRAVVANDIFTAHQSREHLDAQVLCLGERVVGPGMAMEIVRAYLDADFEGGRHRRRLEKIQRLEDRSVTTSSSPQ